MVHWTAIDRISRQIKDITAHGKSVSQQTPGRLRLMKKLSGELISSLHYQHPDPILSSLNGLKACQTSQLYLHVQILFPRSIPARHWRQEHTSLQPEEGISRIRLIILLDFRVF